MALGNKSEVLAEVGARHAVAKWSAPVMARGFTIVPNLLLSHQHALGLSSLHCMLLIHLNAYWWESGRNPYPSKNVLAQRMGISDRQVQRYVSDLVRAGFLRRHQENIRGKGGRMIVSFDLSGLVEKLKAVAEATASSPSSDNS